MLILFLRVHGMTWKISSLRALDQKAGRNQGALFLCGQNELLTSLFIRLEADLGS